MLGGCFDGRNWEKSDDEKMIYYIYCTYHQGYGESVLCVCVNTYIANFLMFQNKY